MLQVTVLCLLLGSSLTVSRNIIDKNEDSSGNEEDELSVSALLERANKNIGKNSTGPKLRELDIAVEYGLQNADPCTASFCKWPKSKDGFVYVPYTISQNYSEEEKEKIEDGLRSFSEPEPPLTCIRFIRRTDQRNYLDIKSLDGCWSRLGRRIGAQQLSLARRGCLSKKIIQHEMMHALGFKHEQSRSDRDKHIAIQWQNIECENWSQFQLVQTNNLGTPYDYNSVMQYERTAFSKNKKPTMVPIPDPNVPIGEAKEMSTNDILRINRLYDCFFV